MKDLNGDFLSDYVRKINQPGRALCIWCNDQLKYAASGKRDLKCHAKSGRHLKIRNERRSMLTLPTVFAATRKTASCVVEDAVLILDANLASETHRFLKKRIQHQRCASSYFCTKDNN